MTPKQILDWFSESLMHDQTILSAQECELLANLLRRAETVASGDFANQQGARMVIASAVGETVAQRAFAVLGESIVERILENNPASADDLNVSPKSPEPPGAPMPPRDPEPPGTSVPHPKPPQHKPPHRKPERPSSPEPPGEPMRSPEPPGHAKSTAVISETGLQAKQRRASLRAQCVILDEFLSPQELEKLTCFALEREAQFTASEIVSPTSERGVINYEHRRSRVLTDMGQYEELLVGRIKMVLPQVLDKLEMEEFVIAGVETQITASNDGDFFRFHSDNASERVAARHLTFVYFFHREPRRFEGGELRIHDARLAEGRYISAGSYQTIVPQQNQIVFFPCELLHEIAPVRCPSRAFADSRFTLNGWLRQ